MRIGIESLQALVGDLGTPFLSAYTAVGDCINFASQLESATRDLPVQVVIGMVANSMLTRDRSVVFVDKGYRGVAVAGVAIWLSGQKRGVTPAIKKAIHRRSAIEPAIGHMKNDGRLRRNWLKGSLGDALHAVLCGAGHNLRMILKALRLYFAFLLAKLSALLPLNKPINQNSLQPLVV